MTEPHGAHWKIFAQEARLGDIRRQLAENDLSTLHCHRLASVIENLMRILDEMSTEIERRPPKGFRVR